MRLLVSAKMFFRLFAPLLFSAAPAPNACRIQRRSTSSQRQEICQLLRRSSGKGTKPSQPRKPRARQLRKRGSCLHRRTARHHSRGIGGDRHYGRGIGGDRHHSRGIGGDRHYGRHLERRSGLAKPTQLRRRRSSDTRLQARHLHPVRSWRGGISSLGQICSTSNVSCKFHSVTRAAVETSEHSAVAERMTGVLLSMAGSTCQHAAVTTGTHDITVAAHRNCKRTGFAGPMCVPVLQWTPAAVASRCQGRLQECLRQRRLLQESLRQRRLASFQQGVRSRGRP